MKQPAVYILTNTRHSVFYTGVTSSLLQRIYQHKTKAVRGFSERYNLDKWVYFELLDDMENAIRREKQLKKWRRSWKIELIETHNPGWLDLWDEYGRKG